MSRKTTTYSQICTVAGCALKCTIHNCVAQRRLGQDVVSTHQQAWWLTLLHPQYHCRSGTSAWVLICNEKKKPEDNNSKMERIQVRDEKNESQKSHNHFKPKARPLLNMKTCNYVMHLKMTTEMNLFHIHLY